MTNRYNVLDVIDRVSKKLRMEVKDCTGGSDQNHSQEEEMQKGRIIV